MHNGVVDALEAGIDWYAEVGPMTGGSGYGGGGNGKGNRILCTMDATITTFKFKLTAVNTRTYKARLFEKGSSVLGTQIGATLSTTGTTDGAETLTFTATDWVINAGTQYLPVVYDDTGAAVTGYYVTDAEFTPGGAVAFCLTNSSVYTDATPIATESYTTDNDIYVMSLAGKLKFPM